MDGHLSSFSPEVSEELEPAIGIKTQKFTHHPTNAHQSSLDKYNPQPDEFQVSREGKIMIHD